MTDVGELESLQGLHTDLLLVAQSQLRSVDRLWAELDAHVDEFRRLLDKPQKNDASRRQLLSGTVRIEEDEYAVNQEFQENAIQLADALDLDEVQSTRLLLEAQEIPRLLDRPILSTAIINFQQRRQILLDCLRLTLTQAVSLDLDEDYRGVSREVIGLVLEAKDGPSRNGAPYIEKCLGAMSDIERWLQDLGDRIQGSIALGQTLSQDIDEVAKFQQQSLAHQHESLGAIISLLVGASYSEPDNFLKLLDHLPRLDRWNHLATHYVPIILAFIAQHGSPEGYGSLRDARRINDRLMDGKDASAWKLRHLQAATQAWWLAEYSAWFQEPRNGSPVEGANLELEAVNRSESFFQALKEGAFQCTLTICSQITPFEWYDPARSSLISYLLRDAPSLQSDTVQTSDWFRLLVMEQLEYFVDAFITNMPDTLRRFKFEEDDQRKRIHSNLQPKGRGGFSEQDLHLERFLVIISFAFDQRTEAAQSFWGDPDSNLHGFLQWASKRQSTPTVGAFCEMLRSISLDEDCATSAHRFLLEENVSGSARSRRYGSLSWAQIFGELSIYTSRIREQPSTSRTTNLYSAKPNPDDIDEPESVLMLESYLRLVSHLCTESAEARTWVLSQSNPNILDTLFTLCNTTVPSRLQACSFILIRSLLTSKTADIALSVWTTLDNWASGAYAPPSIARPSKMASPGAWLKDVTLPAIASTFDQANEFTALLLALMNPQPAEGLNDQLPFPETLGSSYRMSGVEPFVDLVLDKIFATMSTELEEPLRNRVLTFNVLSFIATCLSTFNEDLLILASRSPTPIDEAINTSSLSAYVRQHPFCRTMEWLFNERALSALFATAHKDVNEVAASPPNSPLVLSLQRSIEVMNLLIDLQSTYLNIAMPLVRDQASGGRQAVFNPSLASFEDSVSLHLQLIVDLGLYAGLGNQDLAVSSLRLLGKLASSRRLNSPPTRGASSRQQGNRLISILEQEDEVDRISRSLSLAMQIDQRELEQGPQSSGWTIKSVILEFLVQTLSAAIDQPSLAHILLGFVCKGTQIDVEPESPFANGNSLFHAVLQLVGEYPDGDDTSMHLWALSLRQMGMEVLSILWRSSLTSAIVLTELRANELFFRLILRQQSIDPTTLWNNASLREPEFMYTACAEAVQQYLWQRNSFYEYAATEIRLVEREAFSSTKALVSSALLGTTNTPEGEQLLNLTIFDLLDFIELDVPTIQAHVDYDYFAGVDFSVSAIPLAEGERPNYDMKLVEEMLTLRLNEFRKAGQLKDPSLEQRVVAEAAQILGYFRSANNFNGIAAAKNKALATWTDLMVLTIEICDLDADGKVALILQALQILTPKLEDLAQADGSAGQLIANVIRALLLQFDFRIPVMDNSRTGDFANDRLFQVFISALRAISSSEATMQLRETLYSICYRYLSQMTVAPDGPTRYRHSIQTLRATGERTIEIICDDAFGATPSSRVAALLLLNSLALLAERDRSAYMTESLVRTNFLQIMVDSIEIIPAELRESSARDIFHLLFYYEAKLSLLLTISQSKTGAIEVVGTGLFHAVRASGLFSVDPDIGIEMDNPDALAAYYRLLLCISRIIVSVVLSCGPQNDQTIESSRTFLADNRALVVATFKRRAKIGGVSFDDAGVNIDELVELFTLLIGMTDFLDYEEQQAIQTSGRIGFS